MWESLKRAWAFLTGNDGHCAECDALDTMTDAEIEAWIQRHGGHRLISAPRPANPRRCARHQGRR